MVYAIVLCVESAENLSLYLRGASALPWGAAGGSLLLLTTLYAFTANQLGSGDGAREVSQHTQALAPDT